MIALLASTTLAGCVVVHAELPEELMHDVTIQVDDISFGAVCTHEGKAYSMGATHCMASSRMRCDSDGAWIDTGVC
jgi:hypothetical protein